MKDNYYSAMRDLNKIGVPVFDHWDDPDRFMIDAEEGYDKESGLPWADYYRMGRGGLSFDDFGVNNKVNEILEKYGLFAEWQNPGCLSVCH